jgi:hypothetical protein
MVIELNMSDNEKPVDPPAADPVDPAKEDPPAAADPKPEDEENKPAAAKEEDKKEDDKKEDDKKEDEEKKDEKDADEGTSLLAMPKIPGADMFADDAGSDNTVAREPVLTKCCCCMCACSNETTAEQTCMGCLPIKCGMVSIGIIVWAFTLYIAVSSSFLVLNEYIRWWFPFVTLILLVPAIIGVCFFIGWYTKDCTRTRSNLTSALIMNIVSVVLVTIWAICYYLWLYKNEIVYTGMGEDLTTYKQMTKKGYVFYILADAAFVITLYCYFLCVVRKYVNLFPAESVYGQEGAAKSAPKSTA